MLISAYPNQTVSIKQNVSEIESNYINHVRYGSRMVTFNFTLYFTQKLGFVNTIR